MVRLQLYESVKKDEVVVVKRGDSVRMLQSEGVGVWGE